MQPNRAKSIPLLYDKIFFTNILRILDERGMSINELHDLSGVAAATISDITRGQGNPTISTMTSLAAAIGVPLPELLVPHEPELYKELMELSDLYSKPGLPEGFEHVSAILEPLEAFTVRKWDSITRKKLKKLKHF